MRKLIPTTVLAAALALAALPWVPSMAVAQQSAPALSVDPADLPPLPPIVSAAERNQFVLLATGAGATMGVIAVEIITGGMLLSPLGLPSAAALLTLGGGGVAIAAPTYTIAQRLLAGVATAAAAMGGGYFGGYIARSQPDFLRLDE